LNFKKKLMVETSFRGETSEMLAMRKKIAFAGFTYRGPKGKEKLNAASIFDKESTPGCMIPPS